MKTLGASLLLAFLLGSNLVVADPWINEFHYDNDGTDTGTFVEVAEEGALSGCQIVLYNGANGLTYSTNNVPAAAAGASGVAFSYVDVDPQNGSPDGIALVCGGSVIEFISYEGSFQANNGPAAGMTSTDIGVAESGSTPVGQSLQLQGAGCARSDFFWGGPDSSTKGGENNGQTIECDSLPPALADPWINELHYDNDGDDTGEFVEVAQQGGIASNTYRIVLYNGVTGLPYDEVTVPAATPDASGVAFSAVSIIPIQNGAPDGLALVEAPDKVIQLLSYEGTFTASGGPAAGMSSTDIGKRETASTPVGYSLQLQGTGCSFSAFSWSNPLPRTDGAANAAQTINCGKNGGGFGDPHFETWTGHLYDFMGACDLVLADAPKFEPNLPLLVAVRTTIRQDYSYVESAVVKIGDDMLQVNSFGVWFLNGVEGGDLAEESKSLGPYPIIYEQVNKKNHHFTVTLGNNETIVVKAFKDMVNVHLENADATRFHGSRGMMGDFQTGEVLARDGSSMGMADPNSYAAEWQVHPKEMGKLFQADRFPQYPQACVLPDVAAKTDRRLGEKTLSKKAAEEACSGVGNTRKVACIHDVMATGDLEVADGAF